MTGALTDLQAECEAHGIRLTLAGDGGLAIDAPQDALTQDLLDGLKAHKADLLAILRPTPSTEAKPVCRCGSTTCRDVVLRHAPHNGTTIRRDCRRCGRFLEFPVWYGKEAGHNGQ